MILQNPEGLSINQIITVLKDSKIPKKIIPR